MDTFLVYNIDFRKLFCPFLGERLFFTSDDAKFEKLSTTLSTGLIRILSTTDRIVEQLLSYFVILMICIMVILGV